MTIRVGYTVEQCWHRVPGGTATSALGTASAILETHAVELVGVSGFHRHAPKAEFTPPMAVRSLRLPRRVLYESWHRLRRPEVESVTGPLDVIHATGMAIPPRRAPLVVTVHDLAFEQYPEHATRHGLRFFQRSLDLTRDEADLVLCPSEATKRDTIAAGIDEERVRVVPWGVSPSEAPSRAVATHALAEHGLEAGRYVLFVGTIEPRKNLRALIEAFERMEDQTITLALVGPEGWNEELGAAISRLGERVRLTGFVPAATLNVLYRQAAAFCYPSLLEGFGMPVLEAMAAGAAVVTSATTSTAEVAGDAAVLVDPTDPDAIAAALGRIVADDEYANGLRRAARERAATFTWQRTATLTIDAYTSVLPT